MNCKIRPLPDHSVISCPDYVGSHCCARVEPCPHKTDDEFVVVGYQRKPLIVPWFEVWEGDVDHCKKRGQRVRPIYAKASDL